MEPSSAPWRVIDDVAPDPAVPGAAGVSGAEPDPRRRWLAVGAAVLAIAVAVAAIVAAARPNALVAAQGASDPLASSIADPSAGPVAGLGGSGGDLLVVEVGGAVRRPGLYRLAAGSRVGDAIAAAGGYGPRVDTVAADLALNLAKRLADGDEIHVPSRDESAAAATAGPGSSGGSGGSSGRGGLVDINHASADALDALPGIGPATAAKIIAARAEQPFRTLDELVTRKVLGQAVLTKIRSRVTVGG